MPADPLLLAQMLRGQQEQPAAAAALPDNAARIAALRRYGMIGQLMGVDPTQRAGAALLGQAQGMEQWDREEAVRQRQEQARLQMQAARQAIADRDYQLRAWDMQQRDIREREKMAQTEASRQPYGAIADPITGEMRIYDKAKGEWKDSAQSPQAPAVGMPVPGFGVLPSGMKPPTDAQQKNLYAATTLARAVPMLERVIAGGYQPGKNLDKYASHLPLEGFQGAIQRLTPEWLSTDAGKEFYNSGSKIIASILRPESGGAITNDEWVSYGPMYLPWPGDTPELIADKMAALRERMEVTGRMTGVAGRQWQAPEKASGGSADNTEPGATRDNPIDLD